MMTLPRSLLVLVALAGSARADQPAPPPEPSPAAAPAATSAAPLLDALAHATTAADRLAAAKALAELAPLPVPEVATFLSRSRASTEAARRAVLAQIGADVPDAKGNFHIPGREQASDEKASDQFDWLAKLADLDAGTDGVADVIADVAAIRALAASGKPAAAAVIIDFAFADDGVAYRDECGRYLRRMSPASLPALIRATTKKSDLQRYATYQLERLDRQNPKKALADAATEELAVEILGAFQDSLDREAVFVVLDTVDDPSPVVRAAARKAWLEYTTGREPPPAPKEKLQLNGGKLTDKPMPLWMTSRELADVALRRRLEALTGQKPDGRAKLRDLDAQLFAYHDGQRTERLGKELDAGLALVQAGKPAEATAIFDRILVQAPDHPRLTEMASGYFALGEALEGAGKWKEAAAAFGKAAEVDPRGETGGKALARHHHARGKAAEAAGKSGAGEFARAAEIDAERVAERGGGGRWMLFAGAGGGVLGLLFLALGLARRARTA